MMDIPTYEINQTIYSIGTKRGCRDILQGTILEKHDNQYNIKFEGRALADIRTTFEIFTTRELATQELEAENETITRRMGGHKAHPAKESMIEITKTIPLLSPAEFLEKMGGHQAGGVPSEMTSGL